jgi:hypothetical protein
MAFWLFMIRHLADSGLAFFAQFFAHATSKCNIVARSGEHWWYFAEMPMSGVTHSKRDACLSSSTWVATHRCGRKMGVSGAVNRRVEEPNSFFERFTYPCVDGIGLRRRVPFRRTSRLCLSLGLTLRRRRLGSTAVSRSFSASLAPSQLFL